MSNPTQSLTPIVYTIAGSDSGGGAGIQADLHAMHNFGCHGCTAVTALTAQNSVGVTAVQGSSILKEQLEALLSDLPPAAVKIGMLGNQETCVTVGEFLQQLRQDHPQVPVVLDPVMIATSGARLLDDDAQQALVQHVFPFATVLTPNKYEAEALVGRKLETVEDMEAAGHELLQLGPQSVLLKGGHSSDDEYASDYFCTTVSSDFAPRLCDGNVWLQTKRYDTIHTHGTGCTLSSALASALARGHDCINAACLAKAYVTAGIAQAQGLGKGPGPVAHTGFPHQAEYFPRIVAHPTQRFPQFRTMVPLKTSESEEDRMGSLLPVVDSVEWVQRLCTTTTGISDIQLRIKDDTNIAQRIQEAQDVCKQHNVRLWINDYAQHALDADCYGIHVGQEDLYDLVQNGNIAQLEGVAFGISTHSYAELAVALALEPSYISLGPIFATSSKNVRFAPQTMQGVTKWRSLVEAKVPLVVIGGIEDADRAQQVAQAGADCVAVIGAIVRSNDVPQAVSSLLKVMEEAK